MRLIKKFFLKARTKAISLLNKPRVFVLMLHRVEKVESEELLNNQRLKISPIKLERFIYMCKKRGYSFIGLDHAREILNEKKEGKYIVITIDDGYKDIIKNALPVFKKHKVPFVLYLTTAIPENDFFYWWYALEEILRKNEKIKLSDGSTFACKTKAQKKIAFKTIRDILFETDQKNQKREFYRLFRGYRFSDYTNLGLDWKEIKCLKDSGLTTIGNHSHSHFRFNKCSEEEIIEDIKKSNRLIKEKVGIMPKHFSYPYGDSTVISPKHFKIISRMGFTTATTTEQRAANSKDNLCALPRIELNEEVSNKLLRKLK